MSALRKWDKIPDDKRQTIIKELIDFFDRERDERIGVIAATDLFNFFIESAGKELYNQGIDDAKRAIEARIDEFRYDLDELKES